MKHPTFKKVTGPMPDSVLWVCRKCDKSTWGIEPLNRIIPLCYGKDCRAKNGNPCRMERATKEEVIEANNCVEFKI